jgi:hypothetical protein
MLFANPLGVGTSQTMLGAPWANADEIPLRQVAVSAAKKEIEHSFIFLPRLVFDFDGAIARMFQ